MVGRIISKAALLFLECGLGFTGGGQHVTAGFQFATHQPLIHHPLCRLALAFRTEVRFCAVEQGGYPDFAIKIHFRYHAIAHGYGDTVDDFGARRG